MWLCEMCDCVSLAGTAIPIRTLLQQPGKNKGSLDNCNLLLIVHSMYAKPVINCSPKQLTNSN